MVNYYEKLLTNKKYLSDVTVEEIENLFSVKFKLRNETIVPLVIFFGDFFPTKLPVVAINTDAYHVPNIPHVLSKGTICYLEKEGVTWENDPNIALDFVFKRVEDVLLSNNNVTEFHREFNYYFSTLNNSTSAYSLYPQTNEVEEINIYTSKKNSPIVFLKGDDEARTMLEKLLGTKISKQQNKAWFLPLDKTYEGPVPQEENFWSAEDIKKIVLEHSTQQKLNKLKSSATNKNNYYYLLEIPLTTGQKVTIGVWYKKTKKYSVKATPIIESDPNEVFSIQPIIIYRIDSPSLVERGGGINIKKKILLVGCGSVGSDILFLLNRSGLKDFTIIDSDNLQMENAYRHFLGANDAIKRKKKVFLLKEEMESRYPGTKVEAIDDDILQVIKENRINLNEFNLAIFAIGESNIERRLNELILDTNIPAIFTWVEAYGIGAHALLINSSNKGCYECLIDEELYNTASFAEKSERPFTKNINGCTGTFTPYGGVDSMQTALIASRLALKAISGDALVNSLVSWKGNSKQFEEDGYYTSSRYEKSTEDLENGKENFARNDCKLCGKGLKENDD